MTEKLEQSIIEMLPQINYVIDQVGEALKWVKEVAPEGSYDKILKKAYEVAQYSKDTSNPNFYKTHLVLTSLLSNIKDVTKQEKFSIFDTASKSTEKALEAYKIPTESIEKYGCFKAILLHIIPLAQNNEDLFAVALIDIKHDLQEIIAGMESSNDKAPITSEDYITILGYAFVMANIRMAKLNLLNKVHSIYNEIEILLNSISY